MLVLNQRYKVSVIEAAAYAWGDVGWVLLAEHAPEVLAVQVVDDLVAEVLGDFVGHLTGDAAGDVAFDLSQVVGDALELAGDAGVELLLPFDEGSDVGVELLLGFDEGHDVAGELGEAFGQLDELIGEDEAADAGKYLVIEGVRFAYGHEQVLAALASNTEYVAYRREHGEKAACATELGQAVSYRFKRDGKGWRVFVSTQMMDVPVVTDRKRGAIGVDLNADHLAVADTDASGNYLNAWRVPLVTYGKNTNQAEALIGDAVAGVVRYAREAGKPIVIEKLDFRQKKAALEGQSRRYSRMLSSFSYGKIKAYFVSRGYRQGVEIHQVNPAYSSVIGRVKFMERYGLSVHQAAALVLARRLLGCSERIPRRRVCPVGNGVQVAFTVPARKRVKHVWTYWGAISGQLRPALAAQHRLGRRRRRPNPVQAVARADARVVA